jgi:hypothetical protein
VGPIGVTMTHAIHSCGILEDGKIIYGGEAAGYVCKRCVPPSGATFPPLTGRPEQLADLIRDLDETEVLTLEPGKPVKW